MFHKYLMIAGLLAISGLCIAQGNSRLPESHGSFSSHAQYGNTSLKKESMANILAGEFALYRSEYGLSLDYFLKEARKLNNPYLAEKATHLALHEKQYADMLEAANIWQDAMPNQDDANYFASIANSLNMQHSLAIEHMRKVLYLNGETNFTRIIGQIPKGHPAEGLARHELEQAAMAFPESYDIPLALAILYRNLDQREACLAKTDEALEKSDYNPAVIEYSVRHYVQYQQAEKAQAAYKKAIELHPEDEHIRMSYAQFSMRFNLDEAREQFQFLLAKYPDDDYYLFNLALIHLESQNFGTAEELFKTLLMLGQRTNSASYYLGEIYFYQGKFEQALKAYQATTVGEEKIRAAEQTIRIYIEQSMFEKASSLLNKQLDTIQDKERRERLLALKASLLEKQGLYKEAYELLTQLLDNNPDSIELRYSRAMLAETKNRISDMEQDLRHIIDIQPDSAFALNALGYTLADKTTRYQEAFDLINKARELIPDDPAVLDSLGWVLYRMGKSVEAIKYLEHAHSLMPDAEVAAHLGEVLWVTGNKESARKVLKEALETAPKHKTLLETIERLDIAL